MKDAIRKPNPSTPPKRGVVSVTREQKAKQLPPVGIAPKRILTERLGSQIFLNGLSDLIEIGLDFNHWRGALRNRGIGIL